MSAKDEVLREAVERRDVPFAVAMTADAAGVTWSGSAGEAAPGRPAAEDTIFRVFSMTKAVGSTAAMILIDRGRLGFDTPVDEILPEFGKLQVLDGFDADRPVLRSARTRATVRHLATHTSGLAYEFWNADMARYMAATGHPPILSGLGAALAYPLVRDPGSRWDYGIGIDWLGQVVEAVDGRRIDRFCREEIFGPLGMADTGFEVEDHMKDRLAAAFARDGEDGGFRPVRAALTSQPEFYGMGHALYSTAPDYLRFLRMFLNRGALDGARVLSEEGVERMLADHLGGLAFRRMTTAVPKVSADFDPFPGARLTHSFGFLRNEDDIPGMRSAGSQGWAGIMNTHYWFDPARDLAAVFMTQSRPFAEPRFMAAYAAYERAVYAG